MDQTILDLSRPLIIPDWGALVGLIPGILAIVFVLWFALACRAFATAGPTRRASPARIEPPTAARAPHAGAVVRPDPRRRRSRRAVRGPGVRRRGLGASASWSWSPRSLLVGPAKRCATTTHLEPAQTLPAVVRDGRRRASTCRGRRSGRSSGPSASAPCSAASSSAGWLLAVGRHRPGHRRSSAGSATPGRNTSRPRKPTGPAISRTSPTHACRRAVSAVFGAAVRAAVVIQAGIIPPAVGGAAAGARTARPAASAAPGRLVPRATAPVRRQRTSQ